MSKITKKIKFILNKHYYFLLDNEDYVIEKEEGEIGNDYFIDIVENAFNDAMQEILSKLTYDKEYSKIMANIEELRDYFYNKAWL